MCVSIHEHQDRSNRTVVKVQHPEECKSVVLSKYRNELTRLTIELWVGQFCVLPILLGSFQHVVGSTGFSEQRHWLRC